MPTRTLYSFAGKRERQQQRLRNIKEVCVFFPETGESEGELRRMASIKKSFEGLKGASQSAAKGVADTAVQAAQDAVHQVAESSKETTSTAAEEVSRQTQVTIGSAADKASDTIKGFGQKLGTK